MSRGQLKVADNATWRIDSGILYVHGVMGSRSGDQPNCTRYVIPLDNIAAISTDDDSDRSTDLLLSNDHTMSVFCPFTWLSNEYAQHWGNK